LENTEVTAKANPPPPRNRRGAKSVSAERTSIRQGDTVSTNFNKDMTVEQAFKTHAGARRVFAKFHLGGCSNCAISETETVEQVSEGYGIPLPMLMEELEKLFTQAALQVGDKVRLPDEIRAKVPQLSDAPEIGEIKTLEAGAYTAEFGELRLQGLAEDFIKVTPATVSAA
jgi:hybrid cluster-associated redox disulfide protein